MIASTSKVLSRKYTHEKLPQAHSERWKENGRDSTRDDLWEEELKLSEQLKQFYCDENGKETDSYKTAEIFHQIGLIYGKRSPDKLSIIRSAALLNAAVSRQPCNEKFIQSLKDFCLDLLKTADAVMVDSDLLEIAGKVKEMAKELRTVTKRSLQTISNITYDVLKNTKKDLEKEKTANMKAIQTQVTQKYKNMMIFVSRKCEKIMGVSPCKYSVTGLGSIARSEITPYSDFEHIILLEEGVQIKEKYGKVLEYFRWFSVIFHVIILNLQETIVPCVGIPSMIDKNKIDGTSWFFDTSRSGISFDGMKVYACKMPLGRMEETPKKPWTTELIKPVSEMLKYLDKNVDLKNGYHLADVIMKHCLIFGDEQTYKNFADGVKAVLQSNKDTQQEALIRQLEEDLKNFDILNSLDALYASTKCDIKRFASSLRSRHQ
ncbi:uncharacterized protein LOC143470342 isoform X3 [Clavelina lepadiformis]|uniref:uncharacterized protein LOC143470342 isoform X3 n=1 Tax=Clavelina lepadiformis TaxID=159417 RepID=UPI00404300E0